MVRRAWVATLVTASLSLLPIFGFSVGRADYPPYVTTKKLYAKTDLRGKKAPKIKAEKWLTGKLPKMKGKVVLVDFWATWCPPCRETIPELGEWQKKFRKDLVVIGISAETKETVLKFMKDTSMPYTVGVDSSRATERVLGVEGIPHVLVISADGIVRWQGFPLDDTDKLTTEKLKQIIDVSKAAVAAKATR